MWCCIDSSSSTSASSEASDDFAKRKRIEGLRKRLWPPALAFPATPSSPMSRLGNLAKVGLGGALGVAAEVLVAGVEIREVAASAADRLDVTVFPGFVDGTVHEFADSLQPGQPRLEMSSLLM